MERMRHRRVYTAPRTSSFDDVLLIAGHRLEGDSRVRVPVLRMYKGTIDLSGRSNSADGDSVSVDWQVGTKPTYTGDNTCARDIDEFVRTWHYEAEGTPATITGKRALIEMGPVYTELLVPSIRTRWIFTLLGNAVIYDNTMVFEWEWAVISLSDYLALAALYGRDIRSVDEDEPPSGYTQFVLRH